MSKANGNGSSDGLDPFGRNFQLRPADDLKQRDVVAWNREYLKHDDRKALADERQAALQAAIVAGWIVSPETRYEDVTDAKGKTERRYFLAGIQVDDLRPYEVMYYGTLCNGLFEEAMTVPPRSSSQ